MTELLKAEDVAKKLNVKVSTVYTWARENKNNIPYHRQGNTLRFVEDEIEEWVLKGWVTSKELQV